MGTIAETIRDVESSAEIQYYKNLWEERKAAGASADELHEIHVLADNFRQAFGYTSTDGTGEKFKATGSGSFNSSENIINNVKQTIAPAAEIAPQIFNSPELTARQVAAEFTPATDVIYSSNGSVLDMQIAPAAAQSGSGSGFENALKIGILGLIAVAVLDRILN